MLSNSKLSHTADGEGNDLEKKSLVTSYEVKYAFPIATQQQTPRYLPKRNEDFFPNKNLSSDDHSHFRLWFRHQTLKITQRCSADGCINKSWCTFIHWDSTRQGKNFIYMTFRKKQNCRDRSLTSGCQWQRRVVREPSGWRKCSISWFPWLYTFVKTQTIYLRRGDLYLNKPNLTIKQNKIQHLINTCLLHGGYSIN